MVKINLAKQRQQATECSICLLDIQAKTIIKECQHIYCFNCISEWVKSNKISCPVCRMKFKSFYKLKEKITKKITKRILRDRKHKNQTNDQDSYQQIKIKTIHKFQKKIQIPRDPIIQFITYPILYFPNQIQYYSNNFYFSPYLVNPEMMQYPQALTLY